MVSTPRDILQYGKRQHHLLPHCSHTIGSLSIHTEIPHPTELSLHVFVLESIWRFLSKYPWVLWIQPTQSSHLNIHSETPHNRRIINSGVGAYTQMGIYSENYIKYLRIKYLQLPIKQSTTHPLVLPPAPINHCWACTSMKSTMSVDNTARRRTNELT